MVKRFMSSAFLLAVFVTSSRPADATDYHFRFLEEFFTPIAMSDAGQIAGLFRGPTDRGQHGVVWSPDAGVVDIGFLPGTDNIGIGGINNRGQVVGVCFAASALPFGVQAFLWSQDNGIVGLPVPDGGITSVAEGINDYGDIAGWFTDTETGYYVAPCKWDSAGNVVRLSLAGNTGAAFDINNLGQVVGCLGGYSEVAVIWNPDGTVVNLGMLQGRQWSRAFHVNDAEQTVGYSYGPDGYYLATMWQADDDPIWLGSFGGKYSLPTDLNDLGQVVGYSVGADGYAHGFFWSSATGFCKLYTPERFEGMPWAINNLGQIVGTGYDGEAGRFRVCIWTPVVPVTIDIKPGEYPNTINLRSRGIVPVAVLTTRDFDAVTVDPFTVYFADARPIRWSDEDADGDGDMDAIFYFRIQTLNMTRDSTEAMLTGDTYDNQPIQGTDSVNIVPVGR